MNSDHDHEPEQDPAMTSAGALRSDDEIGDALGRAIQAEVDLGAESEREIKPPSIASIAARAEAKAKARRARQTTGTIAASVALVAGAVLGWGALNDQGVESIEATGTPSVADVAPAQEQAPPGAEVQPAAEAPDPEPQPGPDAERPTAAELSTGPVLEWTEIAGPANEGGAVAGALRSVGDGRIAVQRFSDQGTTELLVSSDGTTWDTIAMPEGMSPTAYDISGDRWAVVGESGVEDDPAAPSRLGPVYVSDDQGATWTARVVDAPTASPVASPYVNHDVVASQVALSGQTVVVVFEEFSYFDLEQWLVDRGLVGDGDSLWGWDVGDGAVTVETGDAFEGAEVTTQTYTFDEMGLTPAEVEALQGPDSGQLQIYAGDGPTLARVYEFAGSPSAATASGDGFELMVFGADGATSLTSSDGRTWSASPVEGFYDPIATSGDVAWQSGWIDGVFVLRRSAAGGPWETVKSFAALSPAEGVKAGPAGLAMLAVVGPEFGREGSGEVPDLSISKDGYELRFNEPEGGLTLIGPTGEPLLVFDAEQANADEAPRGVLENDDGFTLVNVETGEVYVSFTNEDLTAAFGEGDDSAIGETPVQPDTLVGWSADGIDWGWQDIREAFDLDAAAEGFTQLAVGDDFVLAMVQEFPAAEISSDPATDSGDDSVSLGSLEPAIRWFVAEVP